MAGHIRAHGATSPDRTTVPGPQSAAAIGVAPQFAPARSPPPAVRHSCGPPMTVAQHSSPQTVSRGRRVPAPLPNSLCTPRNALACRFHRQDPHHPPRTVESSLITNHTHNESHSRRSKQKPPVGLVMLRLSRISAAPMKRTKRIIGPRPPSSALNCHPTADGICSADSWY